MQLFIQIALLCLINTLLPDFIRNYVSIARKTAEQPELNVFLPAAQSISFLEERQNRHTANANRAGCST